MNLGAGEVKSTSASSRHDVQLDDGYLEDEGAGVFLLVK